MAQNHSGVIAIRHFERHERSFYAGFEAKMPQKAHGYCVHAFEAVPQKL
jgi:hypothetical protein